jgi:hypothetical protein
VTVGNAGGRQVARQGGVELGVTPRAGEAPDVDQARHAVRAQQGEQIGEGAGGVADRPHGHG